MKDRWLRAFRPPGKGTYRLICFPHAGGSASYYYDLSRALAPGIDVLSVQYPGRQDRLYEPCADSILELAEGACSALADWPDSPMALFGHSMGAMVAFEAAYIAATRGDIMPRWLFVSGHGAPARHRGGEIHLQDDAGVISALRRNGGTSEPLLTSDIMARLILPYVRSDYRALETYVYAARPALPCSLTAIAGDSDPLVTLDDLSGWSEHTTARFDIQVFPGGHFYLDDCCEPLARSITGVLRGLPDVRSA